MKRILRHKTFLLALLLSVSTYILFYGQFLTSSHYFWGSDAQIEYVPARTYFYDKIVNEHTFPFWTEKMYSGFPIYADLENAYLNPINDASILIFGPQLSYKILHVLEYLIGSLSLYFLLKRKGIGILGYVAANAIFYFNTFSIDHQIHFNIIMAFYLIPTAFLLADLYIEKRKLRYIVFQSFVVANAVLWGHMQSATIVLLGIIVYMAIFSWKKIRIKPFLFYFFAMMLLVLLEVLLQVIPSFELFQTSSRSIDFNYLKGSLTPQMALFSFIPYLLGGFKDFAGKQISNGFTYTEVYMYLGISSVFLASLALLFLRKTRAVVLSYTFIWIFLLLGFMAYNKIFSPHTPIISLFRDWERTMALASFGVAFLAGVFIDKIKEFSFSSARLGIFFIIAPVAYILLLVKINAGDKIITKIGKFTSFSDIIALPYFPVLRNIFLSLFGIIFLVIIFKYFPKIFKKILLPAKILLAAIIFIDLFYFSRDVLAFRLKDVSDYKITPVPMELADKRVIIRSGNSVGMENLYYASWSPFGYSQFLENDYADFFKTLNLGDPTYHRQSRFNTDNLKNAGITAIVSGNQFTSLGTGSLDIIKNDLEGNYLEKKEGRIVMRLNNPKDTTINTYLKYNSNWKVKVDGQEAPITKNGIFFDFPLNQGNHLVEVYYYPKPFFLAVIFSLILAIIIGLFFFIFRKNVKKWMLE